MNVKLIQRFLVAAISGAFLAPSALAVPAKPGLIPYTQSDGSHIDVRLCGDERHHYYTTSDGYVLLRGAGDDFHYAVVADSELTPSAMLASNPGERSAQSLKLLSAIDTQSQLDILNRQRALAPAKVRSRIAPESELLSFPVTGSPRTLVILVEFSDNQFSVDEPLTTFKRLMSEKGFNDAGATGSVLDYFEYQSGGKFTPEFDVYGPVKLSKSIKYYGGNNGGEDKAPEKMVIEACQALDDEIDFTVYDTDHDGVIDNVYVFYAGYGEADGGPSSTIWPHSWDIYSGAGETVYLDGKLLDHYATSMELDYEKSRLAGIGTFCHEFGHVLSLPDLYATNYASAFTPGEYDIMDGGSYNNSCHTPPAYSGYERYCLGWVDPVELTVADDITLHAISDGGFDDVKLITTEKDNEYYILENRQQVDWDTYIPGHGMLVWHIDYKPSVWYSNTVNNNSSHQYIDIVEADNKRSSSNYAGDPFPGTSKVTSFTDTTTPNMKSWANKALDKPITDIEETNGVITFKFKGGKASGITNMAASAQSCRGAIGSVILNIAQGAAPVAINDLAGRRVLADTLSQGTHEIALSRGVYLVTINGQTSKIVVK